MTSPSKNSFVVFAAFFLGALVNYAYNVSMGWLLTPGQYGMLGVSISFMSILTLFVTSAFPLTVTKFISGNHEESVKHRVFKSCLGANIIIALILSVIFYLGYTTHLIGLGDDYKLLVTGIVFATLLTASEVVYLSILQGTFRFRHYATIGLIVVFFKYTLGLIFVKLGLGAFGAFLGIPISLLIGLILAIIMTRDFRFWETKGRAGSGIYFFVLPMFLGTLGTTLLMNMDIIGVKFLTEGMSDSLSGYYRAALIIAQLPTFLVGALMSVLFPYISKHEDQNIYSLKSIKYAALFILPIAFAIATIPEAFISMMFPAEYLQSATALSVVAIGMGGLTMIMVFTNIFQARNAPRIPAIVLSLAVIIEILSLLRLVPQYGILGAATSTATACLFGAIVLGWLQIRTYNIEMDYRSMLKAVVSIGIMLLVLRTFPHDNLFSLIVDIILCIMIYLIVLAAGNLLTEEDLSIFFAGFSENRAIAAIEGILIKTIKKLNRT